MLQADRKVDLDDTAWAVMREVSKMAYNVDSDQIRRAINQLKAQTLFSQDGPSGDSFTEMYLLGPIVHAFGTMQCSKSSDHEQSNTFVGRPKVWIRLKSKEKKATKASPS